jgi:hypothetical protein
MCPILAAVGLLAQGSTDTSLVETAAISLALFPAVSTAALLLLYGALRRLDASPRAALAATLAIGVGSLFWHYARSGHEENLVALGLALWLFGAAGLAREARWPCLAMAAGAVVALAARWAAAAQLGVLLLVSLALLLRMRRRVRRADLALATALVAGGIAALAAYNQVRFGSFTETGYGLYYEFLQAPMFSFEGFPGRLAALLVSPYRGLLLYSPVVALALLATLRVRGEPQRLLALAGALTLAAALLLAAAFYVWTAGHSWGPRYLVAPQILLGPALADLFARARRSALLVVPLALLQLPSVILPASTEEYLRYDLVERQGEECSAWSLLCAGISRRPALAAEAVANTLAGRPGIVLSGRPYVAPEVVLATSDYRTIAWWPFRMAFRLGTPPLPLAWAVALALLLAATAALALAWRRARGGVLP